MHLMTGDQSPEQIRTVLQMIAEEPLARQLIDHISNVLTDEGLSFSDLMDAFGDHSAWEENYDKPLPLQVAEVLDKLEGCSAVNSEYQSPPKYSLTPIGAEAYQVYLTLLDEASRSTSSSPEKMRDQLQTWFASSSISKGGCGGR